MADVKISALPVATTPLDGTELVPIVQSGVTEQVTVANLTAGRSVAASTVNVDANTADAAVRITQTGAGNALVVEDSASPDASPFVVDATGLLVTGAAASQAANLATGNARVQIVGGTAPLALYRDADSATAINLEFAKRRATGGLLASGDVIGRLYFSGNDGVAAIPAAFIDASVDGTPGVNDMPGRLVFSTTADGAATPTERMRITQAGDIGIGVSAPVNRVQINGLSASTDVLRLTTASDAGVQQEVGLGFGPGLSAQTNPAAAIRALEFDASDSRASMLFYTRSVNTDSAPTERMRISDAGFTTLTGSFGRGAPVTETGNFTLADTENWIICNGAGTITVTFPAASSWTGREVMIKTIAAQTVVSASSNVVPIAGGAAGTAILAASAGAWATLVSDGTNWVIMQA
jgi:hypothetical protein